MFGEVYERVRKDYVEEVRNKIQSEIILIAFDTNKSKKFLNDRKDEYKRFLKTHCGLDANPYRHSLDAFNNFSNKNIIFNLLTKNIIKNSNEKNKINFRARSAKLRAAERIYNMADAA